MRRRARLRLAATARKPRTSIGWSHSDIARPTPPRCLPWSAPRCVRRQGRHDHNIEIHPPAGHAEQAHRHSTSALHMGRSRCAVLKGRTGRQPESAGKKSALRLRGGSRRCGACEEVGRASVPSWPGAHSSRRSTTQADLGREAAVLFCAGQSGAGLCAVCQGKKIFIFALLNTQGQTL
jgi:hypothetical protein